MNTPRIVVGVDGSDASKSALRWAARLATTFGAHIDAVTAWEFPAVLGWSPLAVLDSPGPDIDQLLNRTVDEVFDGHRPDGLRVKALQGPAASTLVAVAEGALMVVLGGRGSGGFSGLHLGSVSSRVAERAGCPVLVVHGDGPPESS